MKKLPVIAMTTLASACMVAVASQAIEQVYELQPLEESAPAANSSEPVDESPGRWFIEFTGAPSAEGGKAADLKAEKQAFRNAVRGAKIRLIENYSYDSLFNGMSVTVSQAELSTLSRLPGVKAIYPVETYQMPEPEASSSPEMATALAQTGADIAQNSLGLDGKGVRVAVIDTGIDIDHPDLGGGGSHGGTAFPSARVVAGWDFVGDAFGTTSGTPVPDGNPDDCGGHGTHVAGIVGGQGTVKGVAPGVTFGAYRVFGCGGSTNADIIVAAMERAYADGMDVINMSLGAGFQWPQYPTAKAASRMVNKGIVVVASAGNSGGNGIYSLGAPSVGDKVISVASFDNTHVRQRFFTVSPDTAPIGFNAATPSPAAPASGTVQLTRTGTAASLADACSTLPAGSLAGRVALIKRGTCTFHVKALNAQNAGASAVVLYNSAASEEPFGASLTGSPSISIPVVAISGVAGRVIDSRLASGPVSLTWTAQVASFRNPSGGLLSAFSSYGLSPDLQLKPDIGAPGGSIYSTYPLERGGYATLSGTSMSSPHVAGAVALLLQAAPHTSSQSVRSILQNSAVPQKWSGNPTANVLDMVHRQGAGMLRIDHAITAATRVDPGKLSLGESESGPAVRTITLRNSGAAAVTYALSSVNGVSSGESTYVPTFFGSDARVSFPVSSVTLEAGQSASVEVTITPASAPAGGIYGGYIVMTPSDGSPVLRVPFSGYIGDYQARQILVPTANGFPWLAKLSAGSYQRQASGATYTMAGGDIPFFPMHFEHQVQKLRMDVVDAATGKSWHRAYQDEYIGRNSTAAGFFAFSWDGTTTAGNKTYTVPNGRYIVQVSVLKALGDESNPAHWERWNSPVITVAR